MINKKQTIQIAKEWYSNNKVKFAMIPYLKNRELALITPSWAEQGKRNIRTIRAHNVQSLDLIRKWLRVDDQGTLYQYYYSVGKYMHGVPKTSMNMIIRKEQTKDWIKGHYNAMTEYDFFIDIDGINHDSFKMTKESARIIKKFFDSMNISYYLRFSGNGFHFIIPYELMTFHYPFNPHGTIKNIYAFYGELAREMQNRFSELVDIKIYDSRRVCKVPYSLAFYPEKIYVCTPINTNEEFENFTLEHATPEHILKEQDFKKPQIFNPSEKTYHIGKQLEYLLLK